MSINLNRRDFSIGVATAMAATGLIDQAHADAKSEAPFRLNYMLASSMYGYIYLGDILPEVKKSGATAIDLWPRKHGSQREQLDAIGIEKYAEMLAEHGVTTGCLTRYDLGRANRIPELNEELKLAGKLGCDCVVTSGFGPYQIKGSELKSAVKAFVETLRPTIEIADENGVRLSIENHAKNLIDSPDSLKWLAEFTPSSGLAIALAPYHLEQDTKMISDLIETLGPAISLFYAWEHGMGCMTRLPKEQELMQMPGRGELDFRPILAAFHKIGFDGWTEIFMHPVPRGIPILESETLVTEEINRARAYLDQIATSL
ncbi:sugar phosphate isomerase/epimerase family protein [Neorhodopirellula pilleata]|uniref:Xylose isomerase-like TIM barrel n=1 Tax=Neorhodopirellula pilleata TaxID=2714738 RepID=A0A5C6AN47_9BACT|nr:sugar phosphate isomerase/epimerase [Neorhodopirellula pilleata]TWU01435.1 Xylose isomerase-like TIM barrel [Neorhodopirellula pilleata]